MKPSLLVMLPATSKLKSATPSPLMSASNRVTFVAESKVRISWPATLVNARHVVDAVTATTDVLVGLTYDLFVARAANQHIATDTTEQNVIPEFTRQNVSAVTTVQNVVSDFTGQQVVAGTT